MIVCPSWTSHAANHIQPGDPSEPPGGMGSVPPTKVPLVRSWLYCYSRYITMHNSVTTNVCTNLFSMPGNKMVPVHGKKTCESDRNQKDMGFQK